MRSNSFRYDLLGPDVYVANSNAVVPKGDGIRSTSSAIYDQPPIPARKTSSQVK